MVNKLVKENILSFVLSIIPDKIINHHKLELLTLIESKITKIKNSFNIKENEYRKYYFPYLYLIILTLRFKKQLLIIILFSLKILLFYLRKKQAN